MKTLLILTMIVFFGTGCVPIGQQSDLTFDERNVVKGGTEIANKAQSLAAFQQTVYPIVKNNTCVNCHNSQTAGQSPVFADPTPEHAFDALTESRKVNLIDPAASRIYLKIRDQSHNCWSGDCQADAAEMLTAIQRWVELAPQNGISGVMTDSKQLPALNSALPAQTEYDAVILQAEQPLYQGEVIEGRFKEGQETIALDGKFLEFSSPESNPTTPAARSLDVNIASFDNCREFNDADLVPNTRAVKIMQQPVHINSGARSPDGVVVDGHRPYTTSLQFSVVRPDKRIEYARLLYSGNFTGVEDFLVQDGSYDRPNPVSNNTPVDSYQGVPVSATNSKTFILPYFTELDKVFNSNGTYKTSGTITNDEGDVIPLYELFKGQTYLPTAETIQQKLVKFSSYKRDSLYRSFKTFVKNWFYNGNNPRNPTTYSFNNSTRDLQMSHLFRRKVDIRFRCPNEPVNPNQPVSAENPLKNCSLNNSWYVPHVTSESGDMLTESNALNCYTLNSSQTDIVSAPSSNCNGNDPRYFHFIDLFMHVKVNLPTERGVVRNEGFRSNSASSYQDLETFANNDSADQEFHKFDATAIELNPDVLYTGGGAEVTPAENLSNFASTLHPVLQSKRCFDCHGGSRTDIPQFAHATASQSLNVLSAGGYINLNNPSSSFRPNGMIHQCNPASNDPRYSCNTANENALRQALVQGIESWKQANRDSAAQNGAQVYKKLSRNERLPGRGKYTFKVTKPGLYNVWVKYKYADPVMNNDTLDKMNFRLLRNGVPVNYSVGSGSVTNNSCYKWTITDTSSRYQWSTPGRASELPNIDQKGYILLDNDKNPLQLPNNRIYYNLSEGEYTLDLIALAEGVRIDAVGASRVENFSTDARLEFQPDLRAVDEKNVSDYKRRVLTFDLSDKLELTNGRKAYFEIEVKKAFDNQNFIFRNPRFRTIPRDFNLFVKGIKVYINGKHSYPDATYNSFEAVVGDNSVLTFAPLLALTQSDQDMISFSFSELSVTSESLTPLFPKGNPPLPVTDRRCNDIDYFVKNVKPILFNAKVILNSDFDDYMNRFPGGPKNGPRAPRAYNCVTCHTANHPYFKMSTFLNDEEFCREALSRVDFQNFYQSLVIRGINGSNNHPKFVFLEKYEIGSDGNFKQHNNGSDYLNGFYKNPVGIASKIHPGPMVIWKKEDMGITTNSYSSLTAIQKTMIERNGLFRTITPRKVNMNVTSFPWYDPTIHDRLLHNDNNSSVLDNNLSAFDVIDPNSSIGWLELNRDRAPIVYDVNGMGTNGLPIIQTVNGFAPGTVPNGRTLIKADTKRFRAAGPTTTPAAERGLGEPAHDKDRIDYISTTPDTETKTQMLLNYEELRDHYRETVVNWIRREHALLNTGGDN